MKLSASLAILAIVGALSGCASTPESAQETALATTSTSTDGSSATGSGIGPAPVHGDPIRGDTDRGTRATDARPDLKRSVYYEFDKFDVRMEHRPLVESHAHWLRSNPQARLTIVGNTDELGSREYNLALGQKRAETVTRMMVMLGVKAEQIEAVSFGKEKPRAPGHDEAAWAENRRSDFADR